MPRFVLVALLAIPLMARADEPKPSPAVKRILEDTARKVRTNRQAFEKANEKPLADARQELHELVAKLNKDGKTKEAIDTLKQVETLDADVMRMANAPMPAGGGAGAGPQKPLLERAAGKWTHPNYKYTFVVERTGEMAEITKTGEVKYTGRLKALSDETAEAMMSHGYKVQVTPAGNDRLAIMVYSPDGKPWGEGRCLTREGK